MPKFIPSITLVEDENSYDQVLVKMVATIHDTHGFISSSVFDSNLGKYRLPFEAKYVENKLVVTDFFIDTLNVKQNVKIGDVLDEINGEKVGIYLLRAKEQTFVLGVLGDGQRIPVVQTGIDNNKIKSDFLGPNLEKKR